MNLILKSDGFFQSALTNENNKGNIYGDIKSNYINIIQE